jgi:hypothetical protein
MARLLIIEDEPRLAAAIARGLQDERHVVDVQADGRVGWVATTSVHREEVEMRGWIPALVALGASSAWAGDKSEREEREEAEVPVALADLPAAVTDAIEAKWPGAKLIEAEKEGETFEVEFKTAAGERLEAEVAPDGKIGKVENEDEDDDDHKGKEDDDEDDD